MKTKKEPTNTPFTPSDYADKLSEDLIEHNRRELYKIEQAHRDSGRKKEVEIDQENPFYRARESKLFLSLRGYAEYLSASGKKYEAKLQEGSLEYRLLKYLAVNPKRMLEDEEIAKNLNFTDSQKERMRHFVNDLRKKFKLNSKSSDNFLISDKRRKYGISCVVEIKD